MRIFRRVLAFLAFFIGIVSIGIGQNLDTISKANSQSPADSSLVNKIDSNGALNTSEPSLPLLGNVLQLDSNAVNQLDSNQLKSIDSLARESDPFFIQVDSGKINAINASSDTANSVAQEKDSNETNFGKGVTAEFTVYKKSVSDDQSFFNALKIQNNLTERISVNARFFLPIEWGFIKNPDAEFEMSPGEIKLIPIRAVMPKNVEGGRSYVVAAMVDVNDTIKTQAFAYIEKLAKHQIEAVPSSQILNFNPITRSATLKLKVSNRGNLSERLILSCKAPATFYIEEKPTLQLAPFKLKPNEDTTLVFNLRYGQWIDSNNSISYFQNRFSYKIMTLEEPVEGSVILRRFASSYFDDTYKRVSPLRLNAGVYNLGGAGKERVVLSASGILLLGPKKEFQYSLGTFNLLRVGQVSLGSGLTNFVYRYNFDYHVRNHRITLGSMFYNRYLPLRYSGLRYTYLKNDHEFSTELGKSFYPNLFVAKTLYNNNNDQLPFKIGGTQTFGNTNYKMGAVEAGLGLRLVKQFDLSGGAYYYFGTIKRDSAAPLIDVNSLGYYANLNFKALNTMNGFRYKFRPLFGNQQLGENHNLNFNGKILNRNSFSRANHRYYGLISRQNILRAGYRQLNINQNFYWVSSFGLKNGWTLNAMPNYKYYERARGNQVSDKFIRTKAPYLGLSLSAIKSLGHQEYLTAVFNPYLTRSQVRIAQLSSGDYFDTETIWNKAYSLGLRYNKTNKISITGDYYKGAYFIYNYNLNYKDSTVSAFSSGLFRFSGRIQSDKIISGIKLSSQFRAFYSIDVRSTSEQLNFGLNETADLGKGFYLKGYLNWYKSTYKGSSENTISTKNLSFNIALTKEFYWQQKFEQFYKLRIICFEDLNGNMVLDTGESVLPNIGIMLKAYKEQLIDKKHSRVPENLLLTNLQGEVYYEKMPGLTYNLSLVELFQISGLHPVNGYSQQVELTKDLELQVPFVKNYVLKGKVMVIKSKFSRIENLDLENWIITAKSPSGETYKTLTDEHGNYTLAISNPGLFTIDCLGNIDKDFLLGGEGAVIDFNGMKEFQYDFVFYEKERTITNGNGDNLKSETQQNNTDLSPQISQVQEDPMLDKLKNKNLEKYTYPEKTISRKQAESTLGKDFEKKIEYRVVIGKFKDYINNDEMGQMIGLVNSSNYNIDLNNNYLIINKDFKLKDSAYNFSDSLKFSGFNSVQVLGKYNETFIDLEN